jgi:7,8-dihydroneopterin aldolase/epimerase/oxygenase
MDKIFFKKFEVVTSIGVLPYEKEKPQVIRIDLEFNIDAKKVSEQDRLESAVNYSEVKSAIHQIICSKHHDLIETLAEKIAQKLLKDFNIFWLRLSLSKPEIFSDMQAVGVTIERKSTS